MKILVATDFAEPARHATQLAVALAERMGDQVMLVHVISPTLVPPVEVSVSLEAMERAVLEGAWARMKEEQDHAAKTGVAINAVVEVGRVVDVIARLSQEKDVRLLVVGSSGRKAAGRFFLGSSAERIVVAAERPTLVVRTPGDESLLKWAKHTMKDRPLRLVVGIERSVACQHAVDWVRSLRAKMSCDVTFVHFYSLPDQFVRLGFQGGDDFLRLDPTTVEILDRELQAFVGDVPGEGETTFKILRDWGNQAGRQLALLGTELDADMLVLGTHQRHGLKRMWLGATTQPTLHASSIPVLCIPAPHDETVKPTLTTKRVRAVLVVTDFSPLSNSAIAHAYGLLAAGGTVHLAHVHERYLPNSLYPYPDACDSVAGTPVEHELKEKLRALVPTDADKLDVETRILIIDGGHTPTAILQTANRLGVDAICMASHGRSGMTKAIMGSVTYEVLKGADRPVHVIRGQLPR